jgi:hypothetical protein
MDFPGFRSMVTPPRLSCEGFLQERHLIHDRPLKPLAQIHVEMADRVVLDGGPLARPARGRFGDGGGTTIASWSQIAIRMGHDNRSALRPGRWNASVREMRAHSSFRQSGASMACRPGSVSGVVVNPTSPGAAPAGMSLGANPNTLRTISTIPNQVGFRSMPTPAYSSN